MSLNFSIICHIPQMSVTEIQCHRSMKSVGLENRLFSGLPLVGKWRCFVNSSDQFWRTLASRKPRNTKNTLGSFELDNVLCHVTYYERATRRTVVRKPNFSLPKDMVDSGPVRQELNLKCCLAKKQHCSKNNNNTKRFWGQKTDHLPTVEETMDGTK